MKLLHRSPFLLLAGSFFISPAIADGPFYGDPPDAHHPWGVHDSNRPQPKIVTPGTFSSQAKPGQPPSDAIVLFDGTEASLANWEPGGKPKDDKRWVAIDGALLGQDTRLKGPLRVTVVNHIGGSVLMPMFAASIIVPSAATKLFGASSSERSSRCSGGSSRAPSSVATSLTCSDASISFKTT